jgi:glutamyl-tRNA reductase
MSLAILNREPRDLPILPGAPVWRTCLREVTFADDAEDLEWPDRDGLQLVEGEAYRLLLEILCGLQSPMLGETQVLGQFKAFLSSLGADQAWLNRVGQRLLTDAREVRTQFLQGLGSRSYGSAVRRYLDDCRHAAVIGTGKLAGEVLPFLADDGRTVDQWGRGEDREEGKGHKADAEPVTYRCLNTLESFPTSHQPAALIIAAPVASAVVDAVAARYATLRCVIDLRGELGSAPLHVAAPVVTLQDLFARMSAAAGLAARHVDAARADIMSRSRRYELRDELRPFGWHDLCA